MNGMNTPLHFEIVVDGESEEMVLDKQERAATRLLEVGWEGSGGRSVGARWKERGSITVQRIPWTFHTSEITQRHDGCE